MEPIWNSLRQRVTSLSRLERIRLGLVLGIGLSLLLLRLQQSHKRFSFHAAGGETEDVAVLVTTRYVPAYQPLGTPAVEVRRFPREWVPPGALHGTPDLTQANGNPRFAAAVALPIGQPLTRTVLLECDAASRIAALLPIGKVAVSFAAERSRSSGGWIQPGDAIAIFESLPPNDSRQAPSRATRLLFPSIQVLAVDGRRLGEPLPAEEQTKKNSWEEMNTAPAETQIFTVLVTPLEAAVLTEARERGPLCSALRASGDDGLWPTVN